MKCLVVNRAGAACALVLLATVHSSPGSNLDTIGVTLLRQTDATLTGSGVKVAQVEAPLSTNLPPPFEVTPSTAGQATNLFTYLSASGTATTFPNGVGVDSGHADSVAGNFYSVSGGVAAQVAHVDNYEANYFYNNIIALSVGLANSERVVNQSWIFSGLSPSMEATVEQNYDNYAAGRNILFCSGAGNSGPISPPATCYNGIGVAVSDGPSSYGPTTNGRSKPDITAPGGATSFSTPYVSGSAAVLMQAANRGDGGSNTAAASDARTIKALLLNEAIKPAGWTNGPVSPLDARYGAGVVNVFNSWKQLGGGQHAFIESTSNASGAPHPPGTNTNNEPALVGWDFNSITNSATSKERVNHYYFNLNSSLGSTFTLTSTLVWNRQNGKSTINNLNLFLYDTATSNLITCCTSAVDNVQHIFLPSLPKGRYDLQVHKNPVNEVSTSEKYALTFEFFNVALNMNLAAGGNVVLSWPDAPAGFNLWATTDLTQSASWSLVSAPVTVSNNQNVVTLPSTGVSQFFRLQRP